MKPSNYSEAGVDVERGDQFAQSIRERLGGGIGGFAGGLELDTRKWKRPVLLSTTDGVGTKLLVAKEFNDYSSIGIDLVAMCVNDLAVCGAQPLSFLDYIACSSINRSILDPVIESVIEGCRMAGCALSGGETAEMPDLYAPDDIDLAGFCVGIVEHDAQLPKIDSIGENDVLIGFPSSGIHSNGLSLARKVLPHDHPRRRELLRPTRIYVDDLQRVAPYIKAAAHITGGGLEGNLARVLPEGLSVHLSWDWNVPSIFHDIATAGRVEPAEMRAVFNMGIGIAMVVDSSSLAPLQQVSDQPVIPLGRVARNG
jgi:phosphoribosylformylglycinamidine cyclo-ligase